MSFVLSKLAGFVTTPSNLVVLIGLAGVLMLATRWRACAVRLIAGGIVLLALLGFSPLGSILMLTLSERFPAWHDDGRIPDGIIVLGGAISPGLSVARGTSELNAGAERMTAAVELSQRFAQTRIVLSGGHGTLLSPASSEAAVGARFMESLGVPRDRIVLEDRSRTTFENALFTRDLLKPKPGEYWLMVTSAYHMPRAIGAFRAVGFDVEPYPVDWRTRGWVSALVPFDAISGGLARTDVAVHEWVGLIGYWLMGRSSALFPAPER